MFIAIIGKRLGEGPPDWESEAAHWSTIANVESFDQILELREEKRARKAAARAAKER